MTYYEDSGIWRDLNTGVDPVWATPTDADGATDAAGDPGAPITTRLEGPWGLPWWDGLENPDAATNLFFIESPEISYPNESVGAVAIVGVYEPAVRTHGPIVAWGHEPSGGLDGDQAMGRIMRFPANIPDRYDANGVWNVDYRDELAAVLAANDQPTITDAQVNDNILAWPGSGGAY